MPPLSFTTAILAVYFLVQFVSADPSPEARKACERIKSREITTAFSNDTSYIKENRDYYNIGLSELKPACIAFPTNSEQVAHIVRILGELPEVQFAVKSGGHSPNPGHSSINDGVLIALRKITGTKFDAEKKLAHIKPGGHWWDVINSMEGTGHTVVGGRLGVVGIGGYLMQGGLSFLSGQYGLGADNVVEYEIVFPNGTIANIHQERHPELVRAMRGGGSQYGIVTKFTVKAHPIKRTWVGIRVYNCTKSEWTEALQDFVGNLNEYPRAATLLAISDPVLALGAGGWAGALQDFTDGIPGWPKNPSAALGALSGLFGGSSGSSNPLESLGSLAGGLEGLGGLGALGGAGGLGSLFGGVGAKRKRAEATKAVEESKTYVQIRNDLRKLSLYSFANVAPASATSEGSCYVPMIYEGGRRPPEEAWGKKFNSFPIEAEYGGFEDYRSIVETTDSMMKYLATRASFRSITLPVQLNNPNYISEIIDLFNEVSQKYSKRLQGIGGMILIFQPFPKIFGHRAEEAGGNAMGLSGTDHDRFVLEIPGLYASKADDELMQEWGKEYTRRLEEHLDREREVVRSKGIYIPEYNPHFMNDAGPDQNCLRSYRDYPKFEALQKQVDPNGMFRRRAGGFRF